MLYRLFYISNASPFFNPDTLAELCEHSAERNRELEIGGALVFNGTNFGQVLEGDRAHVLALADKIQKDVRHTGYNLVNAKEVSDRHFEDWGMSLVHGFDFSELESAMRS